MRLGIDFGTTRTVISAAIDGRFPLASFDIDGDFRDYLPGLVASAGGQLCFGWEAAELLAGGAEAGLRSLKRVIAQRSPDAPIEALPGAPSGLDVATGFLSYVREMLLTRSNLKIKEGEPLEAALAVPAEASSRQRYLTMEAARRAGFTVTRVLNEPTAAAIEYAQRNFSALSARSPKRYIIVYDLGGGTFDTSAVSLMGQRFELLASEGIARLGGDDFDGEILKLALEKIGIEADELSPTALQGALEACQQTKESMRPKARGVLVDLSPWREEGAIVLDAQEIFARCEPLVERTLEPIARILESVRAFGIDPESSRELGALYLVGGASAFPPVTRALKKRYGRKIQLAAQAHASTAIGLAIANDPQGDVLIREATTRYFGVWREAAGGEEKIFDPILNKGTRHEEGEAAPIKITRRYTPSHNVGHLRFLECTQLSGEGRPDGDIVPWREIHFPYDPALADLDDLSEAPLKPSEALGGEQIEETYLYHPDGRIEAIISNARRGYTRRYTLGPVD
ncbi:Hsp70 family protein [Myxococcota bacterium]|nr:Hsp70 family protein [Myxococcota bacterium]MBU1429645.1 Hsp70 family protein [Myxococcota bacterium]MBU1896225.1 Hsp70 family protein [Myxococcota bacterium]